MSHAFWLDIYNLQVPGNAFLVTEENKVTFELYIEGMNGWNMERNLHVNVRVRKGSFLCRISVCPSSVNPIRINELYFIVL